MMKAALTFIVLIFVICASVLAQTPDTASVDIRAILEKQISDIRSRQNQKNETASAETKQQAGVVSLNTLKANKNVKEFLSKDIAAKIFVVVEILMIAGLVYLWGTKKLKNKKRNIAILKSNIKKLREERIGSFQSNSLSILRGKLRYDPIKIDDNGKDITFRARKNNIGKGEVHLAAKIKLLVGDYK